MEHADMLVLCNNETERLCAGRHTVDCSRTEVPDPWRSVA
jgi:hypothetical protein